MNRHEPIQPLSISKFLKRNVSDRYLDTTRRCWSLQQFILVMASSLLQLSQTLSQLSEGQLSYIYRSVKLGEQ